MKALILAVLILLPTPVFAAGGGVHLENANIDLHDEAALQSGAKYFVNYCLNCHSLQYERWQRMQEFGLSLDDIKKNLMPDQAKPGDLLTIAMNKEDAANWFGAPAPDLTLESRLRGPDWIYTYLNTFYADDSRPFGVNNMVFDKVGMPHVLWELQGMQTPVYRFDIEKDGHIESTFKTEAEAVAYAGEHKDDGILKIRKVVDSLKLSTPGKMSSVEYDKMTRELTTFLAYMGEPIKMERQRLGIWVILFLIILFIPAYLLKKEYWKDVH